jgi:imidazolonepropionase-like amidohydrolase
MRSLALCFVCASAIAAPRHYTMITSTGPIATLEVNESGSRADNKWRADDNGRGSKFDEHVELGKDGLPTKWEVTGKGWFGAPVHESFWIEGGKAKWKTNDGAGEADAKNALYLANDSTPYATQLYFRILFKAKDHSHSVVPLGSIHAEKLRDVTIGHGEKVTAWALWGFWLSPAFILARGDQLVAVISPGNVFIEDAHKDEFTPLSRLAGELSAEALRKFTKKVTHPIDGALWITGARLFDAASGKLTAPTNVGIYRDTIVYVGNDPPPKDAVVADGTGATLLPGLFDSHAHYYDWSGPLHLACGVTVGRDPGNDNDSLLTLEDRIKAGEFLGVRLKKSGFLEGKSPNAAHGGFMIDNLEDGKDKVRWYATHGFWGIKIYNSMNPDFVKPLAEEAHRLGLHVSGHVPAFMSSERAVRDGYDEINHINQLMLSFIIDPLKEDTRTLFRFTAVGERMGKLDLKSEPVQKMVKLMLSKKITLDPTIATFAPMILGRPGKTSYVDERWLDHMPVAVQRARRTLTLDIKPEQYATYEASWKRVEETLLMLYKSGIPLVPGTDDMPGYMQHSELEAWVRAGIPAADALRAATLGGAKFLGLDGQIGSIAPGKAADLYLVEGDPTADISNLRKGKLTVRGGNYYFPDEIEAALDVKPFAARAKVK